MIGEAASRAMRADPTLAKRSPELELVEAYRMHNRIAHGYETLN